MPDLAWSQGLALTPLTQAPPPAAVINVPGNGEGRALAVERITGKRVTSVEFVFAALDDVTVSYGEAAVRDLVEEARVAVQWEHEE